jgi:hypothetical protein
MGALLIFSPSLPASGPFLLGALLGVDFAPDLCLPLLGDSSLTTDGLAELHQLLAFCRFTRSSRSDRLGLAPYR